MITLYATGYGLTTPPAEDGRIATSPQTPVLPVSVQISDAPAEVISAATASGLMPGVLQVSVRVSENIAPGDAVPVVLSIGAASSRTGVTVAVR